MDKRTMLVIPALAATLALAGCGNGTAGSASTNSPTPSATPTATSPAPSTTATPTATPSPTAPAPGASWTGETAYAACIAYHREKTTADGFDPDASTWNAYSPEVARQNGEQWIVDLIGKVKGEDGATYDGVFSCLVTGTPAAPSVEEYTAG